MHTSIQRNSKMNPIILSDDTVNSIGGFDKTILYIINNNLIPTDDIFIKRATVQRQILLVGYRYVNGKYGVCMLFDWANNTITEYTIDNGRIKKYIYSSNQT